MNAHLKLRVAFILLIACLGPATLRAEDDAKPELPWRLIPDIHGWKIYGHVSGGVVVNADHPNSRFNGPWNLIDRDGFALNQLWLTVEKPLGEEFGVGGRADIMFGNDYNVLQSRGWELKARRGFEQQWNNGKDYGIAIPQLYAEVGSTTFGVKLGHCGTPLSYESNPATSNFFYSHSYTYQFSPFTHWGALAEWKPSESWSLLGGVINSLDTLDRGSVRPGFLFGGKHVEKDKWSLAATFFLGDDAAFTGYATRFISDLVLDVTLSERVVYVLEGSYANQQNGVRTGDSSWYSVNQHLFYKINDCLKLGGRFEWYRDNNGFIVGGPRVGNPNVGGFAGDFFAFHLGANWAPAASKNLLLRPEIRYDWFDGAGRPFNGRDHQLTFAIDAVIKF